MLSIRIPYVKSIKGAIKLRFHSWPKCWDKPKIHSHQFELSMSSRFEDITVQNEQFSFYPSVTILSVL